MIERTARTGEGELSALFFHAIHAFHVVVFVGDDGGDGLELLGTFEVDEDDAHGVAPGFADFFDAGAHHLAFVRDEHEFVGVAHGEGSDERRSVVGSQVATVAATAPRRL